MNRKKKIRIMCSLLLALITINGLFAQDITTVTALNDDISNHLDLEVVASVFGDSKDLEDFENRLNDPKTQLSNLDLNKDSNVDYLRVVEIVENNTHLIVIQAVLNEDTFQDVATLEVEKDTKGITTIQVVGDVYMYGLNYIIEPIYVHRPLLFSLFWNPIYRPYKSAFYWGYYPKHFHFWHPHPIYTYRKNVHIQINSKHKYTHTHIRKSTTAIHLHKKTRRNDFAINHPNTSYNARLVGVNKTNGTKKRIVGVNKDDGTKKRVVGVNKADGTKKRVYAVKKPDGSKRVVTTTQKKPTIKRSKKNKIKKGNSNGKKRTKKVKDKKRKKKKKKKKKN